MAKKPAAPKKDAPAPAPEAALTTPQPVGPPTPTPPDMPPPPPVGPITSAAAPPAHAGPPPVKKTLLAKARLGVPPTLTFGGDFRQNVRGDLHPGVAVTLAYDGNRLPAEADSLRDGQGRPSWTAYAHLRFGTGTEPVSVPLWAPAGLALHKGSNGFGGSTMLTAVVEVPADAREVEVWFSLDLGQGRVFWDSNHGANYHFRFTHSVVVAHAAVVVPAAAPNDDLEVTIETDADIDGVAIDYVVTNTVPNPPLHGQAVLQPTPGFTATGTKQWAVAGICVPHRAVINFTIRYTAGGQELQDNNNHQGYLVS